MAAPDDFEPAVGEVRAVRTFRVGPGGLLYPLFGRQAWIDGANHAVCTAARTSADHGLHLPPDPECSCGFYAYAELSAAGEYPYARHVLAVVSCWGRLIVGTKGVRSEYARIEALWLGETVPLALRATVADRYPSAQVYADREAMLTARAPTILSDYEPNLPADGRARTAGWLLACAALIAGVLPTAWIAAIPYGWFAWTSILGALLCAGLTQGRHHSDAVAGRRRVVGGALALWMVSPLAGLAGLVFLRLPLLEIVVLLTMKRVAMGRAARTFPAQIN